MVRVNMNDEGEGFALREPGAYLAEVEDVEERMSKAGDPFFSLKLRAVGDGTFLCFDVLMLGGKGWGMGRAKLVALGVPDNYEGDLTPGMLIGKRVMAHTTIETYQGKDRVKVNSNAGHYCGFDVAGASPATEPVHAPQGQRSGILGPDEDTPFEGHTRAPPAEGTAGEL